MLKNSNSVVIYEHIISDGIVLNNICLMILPSHFTGTKNVSLYNTVQCHNSQRRSLVLYFKSKSLKYSATNSLLLKRLNLCIQKLDVKNEVLMKTKIAAFIYCRPRLPTLRRNLNFIPQKVLLRGKTTKNHVRSLTLRFTTYCMQIFSIVIYKN